MGSFIDENFYAKLKREVEKFPKLTRVRAAEICEKLGASERTQRRIKKSRNFSDYLAELRRENSGKSGKNSAKNREKVAKKPRKNFNVNFREISRKEFELSDREKLEFCETALAESVFVHMKCDEKSRAKIRTIEKDFNLCAILWLICGILVGFSASIIIFVNFSGVLR